MTRLLTTALHALLATSTLFGAFLVCVQSATAVAWEQGLYGNTSVLTQAWILVAVMLGLFGVVHAGLTAAWMLGQRWGGVGLLILSTFLAMVVPPPLVYLVIATGIAIGFELFSRPSPNAADRTVS